ncbi:MAG: uroporphyrinogen-III C-methyltransferase [Deltaproteobacteria bacterium]|nr:uroporphyrinogen-III C-methyltransferase [Deltaproteobacteria bacterium]
MTAYQTIPVSLNVTHNNRALVVGGGHIALQKIEWLLKFNMAVNVVATDVREEIDALAKAGTIRLQRKPYDGLDEGLALVIAATNDESVNRAVFRDARAKSIPVNVVDVPEMCTFFVSSVISRGRLQMTIASNGDAPALCRRLRKEVEALAPPFYQTYVDWLADARSRVRKVIKEEAKRATILKHMASERVANQLEQLPKEARQDWFESELAAQMAVAETDTSPVGTVYLVGAGPGDPGLISVKGLRVLASADAVLFDGLVNPKVLDSISPSVERFDTSKRAGCALRSQDEINDLMVNLAQAGKTVCRLKGGDPCVFGRLTSEARALAQHNIPFEIVPGVSSAIGALAYAGIPITDRDAASVFQVVTGHESPLKTESRVNWQDIASSKGTVVFLMGVHRLTDIASKLIANGKPPETPVAIISHGTLPTQAVFETTLGEANNPSIAIPDMQRPALIVVGDVVRLRRQLKWYR